MSQFRYSLSSAPSAFNDGSGVIGHNITALYSDDGETWFTVPGRHKTILIPSDEMKIVMDMPDGTPTEKSEKAVAYKQALVENLNTQNVPLSGWSTAQLQELIDENNAASTEAERANEFITVTLNKSYPVTFNL